MTKGKITISRVSSSTQNDWIRVELLYDDMRVEANVELSDFAQLITGLSRMPCHVDTFKKHLDK